MKCRKLWYCAVLIVLAMLPLAGCSGGDAPYNVTNGPSKVTLNGTVAGASVSKSVAATTTAIGTVKVFNAYSTANNAALGSADIQADGKFSNLAITLPTTKSIVVIVATLTDTSKGPFRLLLPMDMSNPPTGLVNNAVSLTINQASTDICAKVTKDLGLTGQLGDTGVDIPVAKDFLAVANLVVGYGGQYLAYGSSGINLAGALDIAAAAGVDSITTKSADGNIQVKIGKVTTDTPAKLYFAMSDENGAPIDPAAFVKAGNTFRVHLARLDANGDYNNYFGTTTATSTTPSYDALTLDANKTATNFATIKPGLYSYSFTGDIKDTTKTFRGLAFDATKTHTVALQVKATITKDSKLFYQIVNPYLYFRPDGLPITDTREVVATSACTDCHGTLAMDASTGSGHMGARKELVLCIMCHNPGNVQKGVSYEFKSFLHKVHMGAKLPSKSFANFSTMNYPVFSRDSAIDSVPVDCAKCHKRGTDAEGKPFGPDGTSTDPIVQANDAKWKTATIANCTTCHDNRAFNGETQLTVNGVTVPAVAHSAGPQTGDAICVVCHKPTGLEYSGYSVTGAHTVWEKSATNPGIVGKVVSVDNVGPGKYPVVNFQVTDNAGNGINIDAGTLASTISGTNPKALVTKNSVQIHMSIKPTNIPDFLNAKIATDDAMNRFGVTTQTSTGSGSTVTVNANGMKYAGTLGVKDAAKGLYFVNYSSAATTSVTSSGTVTVTSVPTKLPSLTGDYVNGATLAFAVQATRSDVSITHRGVTTAIGTTSTVAAPNPASEAVFTPTAYYDLKTGAVSKDVRRRVIDSAKCANCHNILTAHGGRPNGESCVQCHNPNRNDENFAFLIHKYHTGEEQAVGKFRRYSVSNSIAYPNDRRRCLACHVDANPLPISSYPGYTTYNAFSSTATGDGRIPTVSAACISCHDTAVNSGNDVQHAKGFTNNGTWTAPTATTAAVSTFSETCTVCHNTSARFGAHTLPYNTITDPKPASVGGH